MKKILVLCLTLIMCFNLVACSGGDFQNVKTHEVDSELYSKKEINSAIDTIKSEFKKDWKGCTLTEIYYAGDSVSKDHQDWADRYNADETIVLLSSFDVDSSGGNGSLNSNSTYDGWSWILVRKEGESWVHVDHGY